MSGEETKPRQDPQPGVEALLLAALTAAAAVGFGALLWRPHFEPDFLVFWTAAHRPVGAVYRFEVTPGQPLPLIYPPTFLLVLQPIAVLGREAAYLSWTGLGVFAFVAAGARIAGRLAPLALVVPPVVFAAVTGETSLLIGAAVIGGLASLSRPALAGLLFGVALSLKPQAILLLPVGLAAAGQWRVLAWTVVGGLCMGAGAALAFGPGIWPAWLHILPAYMAYEQQVHLESIALAPAAGPVLRALLLAAGGLLCWTAFRRDDLAARLIALVGASLLAAPHAQGYDTAMMAPAALVLLARRSWARLPAAAFCLGAVTAPAGLLLFVLACATPLAARIDRAFPFPALRLPRLDPPSA